MNKAERMEVRKKVEVALTTISKSAREERLLEIVKVDVPQLLGAVENLEWNMQFMGYPCKRCEKFTQEGHRITTVDGVDMYCNACWDLCADDDTVREAKILESTGLDLGKLREILASGKLSPEGEKTCREFSSWLEGASKIGPEDLNIVLKTTVEILKGSEV